MFSKLIGAATLAASLTTFASIASAQEKIETKDCVYAQRHSTSTIGDVWLCPNGKNYKQDMVAGNWVWVVGKKGVSDFCIHDDDEKAWLCTNSKYSKIIRGNEAPKIQVGAGK